MDKPITRTSKTKSYIKYALLSVVIIGLGSALVLANNSSTQDRKLFNVDANTLVISTVTQGGFSEYLPLRGIVEPEDTIFIDAINGGRVEEVYLQEGAIVDKAQPIVRLSNTSLQLNVLAREAEVSEQINNMRNTRLALEQNQLKLNRDVIRLDYEVLKLEKEYQRNALLAKQDLISTRTFEQIKDELQFQLKYREVVKQSQEKEALLQTQQLEQLAQSIRTLEENLAISRASLENLVVKAPASGQLTFLDAKVGESKGNGQRIGQLDLIENYKVSALVDEFYINRVNKDQQATFEVDGLSYSLSIVKIYPGINNGAFKIDFHINEPAAMAKLRLGQSLQLNFNLSETDSKLQTLNGGFIQSTAGSWIFKVTEDGTKAIKQPIIVGKKNPKSIEIVSGLTTGDQVITSSYASFTDADQLNIVK